MITLDRALPVLILLAVLSGCVTHSVVIEPRDGSTTIVEEPQADPHFEPVPGRGPDVIAALRAEPPPVRPQIIEGKTVLSDRQALGALGFVHVGSSRFEIDDPEAEEKAAAFAADLGAERMLLYRQYTPDDGAQSEFRAVYYVRFKLLFGATFRNLNAQERATVDGAGGVRIGSVVGSTPASQANLMAGDLVLRFNGRPFNDRVEFQELLRNQAGKPVTLTIRRNDVSVERVVRLGAMPTGTADGN